MRFYRQNCPTGALPYIIREGDTLALIAKQYNTTVEDIMTSNPIINPYKLNVGQQICVPLKIQLYPSCPTTNYYVVTENDTFESITSSFKITYEQLYYANYGIDPNDLYEDQILCIPIVIPRYKIIVNVENHELTLKEDDRVIRKYPIAPENPEFPIPRGNFTILNKQVDPGAILGARLLGLSEAGIGIHGTNTPEFIEVQTTDNSVVMSNEDINELFNLVTVGTLTTII